MSTHIVNTNIREYNLQRILSLYRELLEKKISGAPASEIDELEFITVNEEACLVSPAESDRRQLENLGEWIGYFPTEENPFAPSEPLPIEILYARWRALYRLLDGPTDPGDEVIDELLAVQCELDALDPELLRCTEEEEVFV